MLTIRASFRKLFRWWVKPVPLRRTLRPPVHLEGPEDLEARISPAVDVWQPAGVNVLASNAQNWSLKATPTNQDTAQFDGSTSNTAITWDQNFNVQSIVLQNKYNAQMTLNPGVVLVTQTVNGQATSSLNVNYTTPACTMSIANQGGGVSQITNLNLSGQDGAFEVLGGSLTLQGVKNFSQTSINVYFGTTLNLAAGAWLAMADGASLQIYDEATLNVTDSGNGATQLLNDNSAGAILENSGTVNITGAAGGKTIYVDIPVLNKGTLNVNGGGNALQAGSPVTIIGQDALTNNSDLDMTAGSVNLSGATTLTVGNSYTQTGGTFQTTDGLPETFDVGLALTGNATVSGGNIKMGTAATYGELDVNCAAFNLSGEYDPKVNGAMNGQEDKLVFKSGFLNNQNGSTISVTLVGGQPAKGNAYTVIQGSSKPLQNFTNTNLAGLTVNPAQLPNGNYELDQK